MSEFKLLFITHTFLLCAMFSQSSLAGVTAEEILGEYWKDPLFGEAASDTTISIELLPGMVWPNKVDVPLSKNVRFVFTNKSAESHLVAFSVDIKKQLKDERFQKFIKDELYHSQQQVIAGPRHSHSGSATGDAEALVKTLDQWPTVFVKPDDKKEILIRFDILTQIPFICVLKAHEDKAYKGVIDIIESTDLKNIMQ
ncbi:MAG: hypothetical protein ACI84K_001573 [Pseudohongiellaceae bacterium]|jgi:hypothetical protein